MLKSQVMGNFVCAIGVSFTLSLTLGCSADDPNSNDSANVLPSNDPDAPGNAADNQPSLIQYFGRWDLSNPEQATASWGAVYLKAKFEGRSLTIKLNDPRNDFEYSIDGGPLQRLSPTSAAEYQLATGLVDGVHSVEFYRRTGGSFGRTVVSGFVLDEGKKLLQPDSPRPHSIEIVGDSISVGYGNENGPNDTGTSRRTENGQQAYGPQLARMLDAEWSVIAHSGQGVYRNLGEELNLIGQSLHMPDEFKLTFWPSAGDNPQWNFANWQPDVFIVTLGTNDFAWKQWDKDPGPGWEPTREAYVASYKQFLEFVREVYPKTEIFAVGTFLATAANQFGRCNEYICEAVRATTDAHTHCVDPSFTGPDGAWLPDGTSYIGDWTHPTTTGHTAIAEHLRDIIKPIVGW